MPEQHQTYEEPIAGAGAARASTTRPAGEVLATPGGTAAARERVTIDTVPRERLSGAIRYFRNSDSARLTADAKDFVRRHPASLAGAAAAGFLLGRLLRRL
jgi:ElaB/YqjD/DUF883 family membrane-anchored ribosome-binding protein